MNNSNLSGTNKTVVITGASRGIGRAIALKAAKNGYNVAISCRNNEKLLNETAEKIIECGVECLTFVGDMGDPSDVHTFFNEINNKFERADILVNNAGISITGLFQEMSNEEWQEIFHNNIDSCFLCSKEFAKKAINEKSGAIINISSIWGEFGAACEVAYSATKGAVNAFTKALAKELAPSCISVNAISCGAIDTDMNKIFSEEEIHNLEEEIPCTRMGTPEEVADLALSLFEAPLYLTGQIIRIDGGWM